MHIDKVPISKPEILSPVGYWPQLHAAVEAGADAVYFGLTHFTARAKVGFTLAASACFFWVSSACCIN